MAIAEGYFVRLRMHHKRAAKWVPWITGTGFPVEKGAAREGYYTRWPVPNPQISFFFSGKENAQTFIVLDIVFEVQLFPTLLRNHLAGSI
ncbi:hypothetical protein MKW98_023521 [Papaver atlanticum]|uniref:Uncharacterized protein n=1 Tax=Papaver atlanticum TaxID=357466 RepID=A0AAD4XKT9_9MAGN|nr:hypothetical protein MKW98_023521 [Papaver atlanticum]